MVQKIGKSIFPLTLIAFVLVAASDASTFCQSTIDDGSVVNNYTAFTPPINRNLAFADDSQDPNSPYQQALREGIPKFNQFYGKYYVPQGQALDQKQARALLSSLYDKTWLDSLYADPNDASTTWIKDPACAQSAQDHMATKPNVYIFVGGFGQQVQLNNTYIDAAELVKWVNTHDPDALFISLGWGCDTAAATGRTWCLQKARDYTPPKWKPGSTDYFPSAPEWDRIYSATVKAGQAKTVLSQLDTMGEANDSQYNKSLGHGLEMAANLVNIILAANIGDIHFIGYSLGAHLVSEILTFDYDLTGGADPSKDGFPWSTPGACQDGSQKCRIAYLNKVQGSFAMGLPGWSPALRYSYNGFRYNQVIGDDGNPHYTISSPRDPDDRRRYENGGLFRVQDTTYDAVKLDPLSDSPASILQKGRRVTFNNKLTAFNKRFDPTSIADDSYERGVNDVMFDDYNHYGHDYIRPYFWSPAWVSMFEKYTAAARPNPLPDWGVEWESGANFDFQDCNIGACNPKSIYAAHQNLDSHYGLIPMQPVKPVSIVQVAGSLGGAQTMAMQVGDNDTPLQAYTMDQEDLRGAVEISYQPQFALGDGNVHGIFSYADPNGSTSDLMPEAYITEAGDLQFDLRYQGQSYSALINHTALGLAVGQGKWTQFSFSWSLPVVSLRDEIKTAEPDRQAAIVSTYKAMVPLADGLFANPRTSMKRQLSSAGNIGNLRIWVNGNKAVEAPLGDESSNRDCLLHDAVITGQNFNLFGTNFTYGAYNPYRNYTGDTINLGAGIPSLGTLCKAYVIRNTPVYIGVAQGKNANALFDNVRLIFGEGREKFPEVNVDGTLKAWEDLAGLM